MVAKPSTMADDRPLTPQDVRDRASAFREDHIDEEGASLLAAILTPRSRARIVDVLVGSPGEDLTVAEICEQADIDRGTFTRQKMPLLDVGIMEQGEQVANAKTYRINRDHPIAQLVGMLDQVLRFGTTSMLLDEQFVQSPGEDYEPGEHPNDPRGAEEE